MNQDFNDFYGNNNSNNEKNDNKDNYIDNNISNLETNGNNSSAIRNDNNVLEEKKLKDTNNMVKNNNKKKLILIGFYTILVVTVVIIIFMYLNTGGKKYNVSFDTDGGEKISFQMISEGNKVIKPSTNPTKNGYTFKEWQLNGKTYDFNTAVTGNITLKAVWEVNKLIITFNSDGGSSVATQTIDYNRKVIKPSNPTKSGYTFKEWQLDGKTYNFDSVVTDNITLTAVWKAITASQLLSRDFNNRQTCMKKINNNSPYYGKGDIIYYYSDIYDLKKSEDCLKNYVWYSGKLWRITAIYPDGTIKMVTENPMTSLIYGTDTTWNTSEIKKWIDNVFTPTLYNKENILLTGNNAKWNVRKMSMPDDDPYLASNSSDIVMGTVGLLNAYEYLKSFTDKYDSAESYLNNGQYWWLMNSLDSSDVYYVYNNGRGSALERSGHTPSSNVYGVRPSIYLKSDVIFNNGLGTRDNPYTISDDKEIAKKNSYLKDRANGINGEYIKFNNEVYRILGYEGTTTKIVKADFIKNNGVILYKSFGTDSYLDTQSEGDYWDNFLVNDWFNSIAIKYQKMVATNTNPSIQEELAGKYYKKSLEDGSYTEVIHDTQSYYNKVGLLRYGEMFASQLSLESHLNSWFSLMEMWLSWPSNSHRLFIIRSSGIGEGSDVSETLAVRPTLNLKSSVTITGGQGTFNNPYEIACNKCS